VRVSTFEQLSAAVRGNDRKVIIVTGVIRQAAKVVVGSNKTIRGSKGARMCQREGQVIAPLTFHRTSRHRALD
jgi:hypothetical protein